MNRSECICGKDIIEIVLPQEIVEALDQRTLWVHDDSTFSMLCYEGDETAFAQPYTADRYVAIGSDQHYV